VFAGWSTNSGMPQRYIHYFGNEGCESVLQAYGIFPKSHMPNTLKTKLCPNCVEPNTFCFKEVDIEELRNLHFIV
jgi:hypothetical protein